MKFDSYSRFLKSSLYQECMRAEVDGRPLPDPYQIPCSPAPSKHSASSDRSTLSTPKKVPLLLFGCIKGAFHGSVTLLTLLISPVRQVKFLFLFCDQQEARKQRSGRSLNEDSRDESADKKRGIFFSWSRNRSFGKGPKKKDIGDINLGENRINWRVAFWLRTSPKFKAFATNKLPKC